MLINYQYEWISIVKDICTESFLLNDANLDILIADYFIQHIRSFKEIPFKFHWKQLVLRLFDYDTAISLKLFKYVLLTRREICIKDRHFRFSKLIVCSFQHNWSELVFDIIHIEWGKTKNKVEYGIALFESGTFIFEAFQMYDFKTKISLLNIMVDSLFYFSDTEMRKYVAVEDLSILFIEFRTIYHIKRIYILIQHFLSNSEFEIANCLISHLDMPKLFELYSQNEETKYKRMILFIKDCYENYVLSSKD